LKIVNETHVACISAYALVYNCRHNFLFFIPGLMMYILVGAHCSVATEAVFHERATFTD
jgi:hypothetical protein